MRTKGWPDDELSYIEYLQVIEWINKLRPARGDKERINFALEFLNIAESDTAAGKILHEAKLYSLSVYHTQQAIEKLAKCWYILVSDKNLQEIKEELRGRNGIGHRSPEAFLKLLTEEIKKKTDELTDEDKEKYEKILEKSKKETTKNVSINPETLNISSLKTTEKLIEYSSSIIEYFRRESTVSRLVMEYFGVSQETDNKTAENSKLYLLFGTKSAIIYRLSIYTFEHESKTRYPDSKPKPSDYQKGMDIVDALPRLFEEIEDILKVFKNVFSDLEEAQP